MRRSAALAGLVLALSACSGSNGIQPEYIPELLDPADAPNATILGPVAVPRIEISGDPVAVPSTTTTIAPDQIPIEAVDPDPVTTTTTAAAAVAPTPPIEVSANPLPLEGTVALTFDDGPFDGWTDAILDVLAAENVQATFFISTYRLPQIGHLIPDIMAAGHSVQSHSDHHEDLTLMSEEDIRTELARSIDKLVDAGAPRPTCVRPPYGATNEIVNRIAADLGLQVVGWTLNSLDYSLKDDRVIDTTLGNVQPGDNVLMHDQWAPVWETALPVVIRGIRDKGIGFSTICAVPLPTG
jgi:peptidoglycan-N-acetylglucosamine deacetylase